MSSHAWPERHDGRRCIEEDGEMSNADKAKSASGKTREKITWRHVDPNIDLIGRFTTGEVIAPHDIVLAASLAGAPDFCGVCWHDITSS